MPHSRNQKTTRSPRPGRQRHDPAQLLDCRTRRPLHRRQPRPHASRLLPAHSRVGWASSPPIRASCLNLFSRHIISVAEFPQFGNELANLIYLPRTLNRRKSADIKQRALDLAVRLIAAKVFTPEDYERLKQLREW